jgi:hypothetical protein
MNPSLRSVVEERRRHLATPGVLDANEQDLGHLLHQLALRLSDGHETFAAKAVRQDGNVIVEAHLAERLDGLPNDTLDRFGRDDAAKLGREVVRLPFQVGLGRRIEVRHHEAR